MCGIAGSTNNNFILSREELKHRGPDAFGSFDNDKVRLYHWRLSIIDVKGGNQPIFNEDKSVVLIFNGEIYNYKELRKKYLQNHKFYTDTDTEVMVHMYEEFGSGFVKYLNGDFAIALWDENAKKLFLYRDRLGIRPLYYAYSSGELYFASEIKPLLKIPGFKKELDFSALDSYLNLRYIVDREKTFFKNIKKIPPAHFLEYDFSDKKGRLNQYWNVEFSHNRQMKEREYVEAFKNLFSDSVRLRMISDVPVGAYLSGGIDSSSIVHEMSRHSQMPIKTFSIGFRSKIDETDQAEKYAKLYNADHRSFYLNPSDYVIYEDLIYYLDELVGDPITLPTYLLSKKAAESVKVVLTGEGADEILGGYIHQVLFFYVRKYWKGLPRVLKNTNMAFLKATPHRVLNKFFPYPEDIGAGGKDKLVHFLEKMSNNGAGVLELIQVFSDKEKADLFNGGFYEKLKRESEFSNVYKVDSFEELLDYDLKHWLPNYTLLKQDRMTMANSLEGRSPFLDHRLVELCARIPNNLRIRNFQTKILLRRAMAGELPDDIVKRKKRAFYLPVYSVFDSGFRLYLKEILSKKELEKTGFLSYDYVNSLLRKEKDLLCGKKIFSVFLLHLWFKKFIL